MKKHLTEHLHIDLRRMHPGLLGIWVAGLALVFAGVLAVTLAAGVLFINVFDADVVPKDASSGVETIGRDALSRSVRMIDARIGEFERLTADSPISPDPSR